MKLLREPLLHFLLLGAGMFAAYAWLDGAGQGSTSHREVRISDGDVRWAAETWARQWQRSPSREELREVVIDLLKEDLLAREARDLGLDKDDAVVRRRLAQKMTFLIEDTSRLTEPTDEELRQFYEAHSREFLRKARVSFTQVFFDRARTTAAADAQHALIELASANRTTPVADKGDRLLIEPQVNDADEGSVAAQFGQEFARAVFALAPSEWHGPIESAYGLHLVRVSEFKPEEQRPFLEVRDQVLESWRDEQRQEADKQYFAELAKKYEIIVDDSVKALVGPLDLEPEPAR